MVECWNCNESYAEQVNYCGSCGLPQKPEMAARRFWHDFTDFVRAVRDIIELVGMQGNPEMTAKGLTDYLDVDVSETTWKDRFTPTPIPWLEEQMIHQWFNYHELTVDKILKAAEKAGIDIELDNDNPDQPEEPLPDTTNANCPCGNSLPKNPPEIISRWNDGIDAIAVCFPCFGDINNQLRTAD